MKKILLLTIIAAASAYAQVPAPLPQGFHTHDGFYLSMSIGPAFGDITLDAQNTSYNTMTFKGIGGQFDFRIGGVIADNLILSFDMGGRNIMSPEVEIDGVNQGTLVNMSITDVIYGVGLTYYFMPSNFFISGTLGIGSFSLNNINGNYSTSSTRPGTGLQFKAGKEWWVSSDWGLGIAGGIGYVAADEKTLMYSSYRGRLSTTRFFLLFSATYN